MPADEGIVVMLIRTAAPSSAQALAQNEQTTRQVTQALDDLHLRGKYKFTANRFNRANATQAAFHPDQRDGAPLSLRLYRPTTLCEPSGFEVSKYIVVTFDDAELADPAFDGTLAATIDTLTTAGALQPELPQAVQTNRSGPVFFTVKDPQPVQLEGIRRATERARAEAEDVAKSAGVKLDAIIDARVNRPLELQLPREQELTILNELGVRFYSNSRDAVTIPATFAVHYATRK